MPVLLGELPKITFELWSVNDFGRLRIIGHQYHPTSFPPGMSCRFELRTSPAGSFPQPISRLHSLGRHASFAAETANTLPVMHRFTRGPYLGKFCSQQSYEVSFMCKYITVQSIVVAGLPNITKSSALRRTSPLSEVD